MKDKDYFSSVLVSPLNSIEELFGPPTKHSYLSSEVIPLRKVEGEKCIYLPCFDEALSEEEYSLRLQDYGLKFCKNAPNYLLGIAKHVPIATIYEFFGRRNLEFIEAVEPENNSSLFINPHINPSMKKGFLNMRPDASNRRDWDVQITVGRNWINKNIVTLAEVI